MTSKASVSILEFISKHRIVMLLASILCMIIGSPFLEDIFHFKVIPTIFTTLIFILGIHAISRKKRHVFIALALAIPTFIGVWSVYVFESYLPVVYGRFFGTLFIGFVISLLTNFIFSEKEVTKEVIFAAVVVYLLLAMMWANVYLILEFYNPGSFSIPEGQTRDSYQFLYFSFVTITTLGYGDVAPLSLKASSLVVLEAVTGQIYLVVVVAWLVGMYVSRISQKSKR